MRAVAILLAVVVVTAGAMYFLRVRRPPAACRDDEIRFPGEAEPVVPPDGAARDGSAGHVADEPVESKPSGSEPVVPVLETVPVAIPPVDEARLRTLTASLADSSVPIKKRREEIRTLAEKADAGDVSLLMALGKTDIYLNFAAVDALGGMDDERFNNSINAYLLARIHDAGGDLKVLNVAITRYAQRLGEDAIPELEKVIRGNRTRNDGFEIMVLTAAVRALDSIGSRKAVPILVEELARHTEKGWQLEYGSTLVNALGKLGTSPAKAAISGYASYLETRKPDDPLAGPYYQAKIDEARKAAGR